MSFDGQWQGFNFQEAQIKVYGVCLDESSVLFGIRIEEFPGQPTRILSELWFQ